MRCMILCVYNISYKLIAQRIGLQWLVKIMLNIKITIWNFIVDASYYWTPCSFCKSTATHELLGPESLLLSVAVLFTNEEKQTGRQTSWTIILKKKKAAARQIGKRNKNKEAKTRPEFEKYGNILQKINHRLCQVERFHGSTTTIHEHIQTRWTHDYICFR